MKHARCLGWSLAAAMLGFAWTAYAQDAAAPVAVSAVDPLYGAVIELVKGGGLPAVLALLGWLAGRGQLHLPVTLSLSDEDRRLLRRLRPRLEDDEPTSPGAQP